MQKRVRDPKMLNVHVSRLLYYSILVVYSSIYPSINQLIKFFHAFYAIYVPAGVQGHNTSSTSIRVQWQTVQAADSNTTVQSYTVTYRALPAGSLQIKVVMAPATQGELKGLKEYTKYNIYLLTSNLYGDGNKSALITVSTDEDSKF